MLKNRPVEIAHGLQHGPADGDVKFFAGRLIAAQNVRHVGAVHACDTRDFSGHAMRPADNRNRPRADFAFRFCRVTLHGLGKVNMMTYLYACQIMNA